MPSNEQIIEAARRKLSQREVTNLRIHYYAEGDCADVTFSSKDTIFVNADDILAVVLESEKEQHNGKGCSFCKNVLCGDPLCVSYWEGMNTGFEMGKSQLKRLNREGLKLPQTISDLFTEPIAERCLTCDHVDKRENFSPFMCLHDECSCTSVFHAKVDAK